MLFPISQATDGSTLGFFPAEVLAWLVEFVTLFSTDEFDNKSVLLTLSVRQSVGYRNACRLLHWWAGPFLVLDLLENPKAILGFLKFQGSLSSSHCWMESMAASASYTDPLRWLILLSWALHQLLRSFICFLVNCIDFKTESYLSLINCCDDSIASRRFDTWLVIRQFTFSISVFSSFLISFLMLGRNSVFQISQMLLTVSGSEEEAIFVAELRSCVRSPWYPGSASSARYKYSLDMYLVEMMFTSWLYFS